MDSQPNPTQAESNRNAGLEAPAVALVTERRRWFASFPEGSLEFVAVFRILWILALFVAPVTEGFVRRFAGAGIIGLLLADCGLAIWWLTHTALDRMSLLEPGKAFSSKQIQRRCLAASVAAVTAHGVLLVFILSLVGVVNPLTQAVPTGPLRWAIVPVYVVLVIATVITGRWAALGCPIRTVLLTVPFMHWWAIRHSAFDIGKAFAAALAERTGKPPITFDTTRAVANAMWVLFMLMVGAMLYATSRGTIAEWKAMCGGMVAAVAAVADVAAMESVQQVYLRYLRTAKIA
ncbi:MAG: hypothetical protein JXA69_06570 [Phycisphaerae bacterium]|nr:hypothetical protein [Phycisphaerae bacterium]